MGSVIAYWNAVCGDRKVRSDMIAWLFELAEFSEARLSDVPVARPAFLEALAESRGAKETREQDLIQLFDGKLTGRILVAPELCNSDDAVSENIVRKESIADIDSWPTENDQSAAAVYSTADKAFYPLTLSTLNLHGIAFRLYDPRGIYPGEDWLSFIFVDAAEFPPLHGRLVQVYDRGQCQQFHEGLVRVCDWYLAEPSIHLRYYLEDWFDLLMTWLKVFFLPELNYSRYESLSQFESFRTTIDEIVLARSYEYAKQSVFEYLIERFKAEANDWSGFVANLATELNSKVAGMAAKHDSTPGVPATVERDADAKIQRAFAMLHSHDTRRAIQGCSDLVALFPGSFAFIEQALADPGLENRHDDILYAVSRSGETALPLMESIIARLFSPTANIAVRVFGGQALVRLGRGGYPRILELLKSPEQYDWPTIRDHVFNQLQTGDLADILNKAIRDPDTNTVRCMCQYFADYNLCSDSDEDRKAESEVIDVLFEQLPTAKERRREAILVALISRGRKLLPRWISMISANEETLRIAGLVGLARLYKTSPDDAFDDVQTYALLRTCIEGVHDASLNLRLAAVLATQSISEALVNKQLRLGLETDNADVAVQIARSHQLIVSRSWGRQRLQEAVAKLVRQEKLDIIARRRIAAVDVETAPRTNLVSFKLVRDGLADQEDPWRSDYLMAVQHVKPALSRLLIKPVICCLDGEPNLQVVAIQTLEIFRESISEEDLKPVVSCLQSLPSEVRAQAAKTLGSFAPVAIEVLTGLTHALSDPVVDVARFACRALGRQGKSAATVVSDIIAVSHRFELDAVEALAAIGTEQACHAVYHIYCHNAPDPEDEDDSELRKVSGSWLRSWGMLPDNDAS